MSAGKGDGLRKGADMKKFRGNYDSIFRKESEAKEFADKRIAIAANKNKPKKPTT